jgi:hypothetical protein
MLSTGEILEAIAVRAAERRRAKKRSSGNLQGGLQLELFPAQLVMTTERPSADRPLADLFPEAYGRRT